MTLGLGDQGGLHGGRVKHTPTREAPEAYQEFPIEFQSKLWVQQRKWRYLEIHKNFLLAFLTVDCIALTKKKIRDV